MAKVVQTVRFLIGVSLVAGGAILAGPFVSAVVLAYCRSLDSSATGSVPSASEPEAVGLEGQSAPVHTNRSFGGAGSHTIPDSRPAGLFGSAGQTSDLTIEETPLSSAVAQSIQAPPSLPQAYLPPTPPPPLPVRPDDRSHAAPGLDTTYRSTLDIPPPPLLDAQAPPPLTVGWSAHNPPLAATGGASLPSQESSPLTEAALAPVVPPSPAATAVIVRDGDDLTSIATRVYGHPGAASAIWAANRDRLPSPELLPIGLELRMPPSWTVPATRLGRGSESIEPNAAIVQAGMPQRDNGAGVLPAASWLATPPPSQAIAPVPGPVRPGTVRVGLGESLASLAQRFYGDRARADSIWAANRDRLRSPELLVPGMELRLP
ncbi:MAG: LysM peptidoglycan-binding domain-containing protein [Planctomycetia bacterium]|nr:LysM peptidoglycan-binding domain-containing protein [Planctomycetia bacterium]